MTDQWKWLASTRKLQAEAFSVNYDELTGAKYADYVIYNALALEDEIHEGLAELNWKPWSKDRGTVNRDAFISEMVDAAHFLGNLLAALNVTDEEWEAAYQEKQQRNVARQRQAGGYDAKSNHCPECHRELDKPGAMMDGRCVGCGKLLV